MEKTDRFEKKKKSSHFEKSPFSRKAATVSAPSLEILKVFLQDANYKGDDYGVGGAHYDIFKMFESV